MAAERTQTPFVDEVPRLLAERGLSIRALARGVGVTDAIYRAFSEASITSARVPNSRGGSRSR